MDARMELAPNTWMYLLKIELAYKWLLVYLANCSMTETKD